MNKLRIGIWMEQNMGPDAGGGFGYYTQLLHALKSYTSPNIQLIFLSKQFPKDWDASIPVYQIKTVYAKPSLLKRAYNIAKRITGRSRSNVSDPYSENLYQQNLKAELGKVVDCIYYLMPGCKVKNFPFIYTLWDLGHISSYAFPELSMNGTFERRMREHEEFLPKALKIFCESEAGKKDAVTFARIPTQRVNVVPLFPSGYASENLIAQKPTTLSHDSQFLFYPAQYWAHKNHYNLLVAFSILKRDLPSIKLVLTGADKGNKKYVISLINELELSEFVIDLGFVSFPEIKWLYTNSLGMVMPSLLGPTNMPLLEAAELDCPVACSDLPGHREQLGDYAYYFDPLDINDMAAQIGGLIYDKHAGVKRQYEKKFTLAAAVKAIDEGFNEVAAIRKCWGEFDQIF